MNTVIPEFVERVDFEKGPYYADVGNYGSAGSAHVVFFKTLPQNFFKVEGGMYGYGRAVFGVSQKLGLGNLLYGGEAYHDDSPWKHPDNYYKFNGFLAYSRGGDADGFASRPALTMENGTRVIKSPITPCPSLVSSAH
jgi:hypothetical protein